MERLITLENCRRELEKGGVVQVERLFWSTDKWKQYKLLKDVRVKLSNGNIVTIPKGLMWDLSSSPRLLWPILPPDGDFIIAALIHDYLYQNNHVLTFTRRFADKEMYKWSKVSNGTGKKISIKNWDNKVRYIAVRLFGGFVWNAKD